MTRYNSRSRISNINTLSNRSKNALMKAGIKRVSDITKHLESGKKLSEIKGVGAGSQKDIEMFLESINKPTKAVPPKRRKRRKRQASQRSNASTATQKAQDSSETSKSESKAEPSKVETSSSEQKKASIPQTPSKPKKTPTILVVGGSVVGTPKPPKSLVKAIHDISTREFSEDSNLMLQPNMGSLMAELIVQNIQEFLGEAWVIDDDSPIAPTVVDALEPYADFVFRS